MSAFMYFAVSLQYAIWSSCQNYILSICSKKKTFINIELRKRKDAINLLTKVWQLFHKTPPQIGCRPVVTNTQQVMRRCSDHFCGELSPPPTPTPAWSFFTSTPFQARQWKVRRRPPHTGEDGERLYLNRSAGQPRHGASGRVGDADKPPPPALLSAAVFHPPFGLCFPPSPSISLSICSLQQHLQPINTSSSERNRIDIAQV